MYSIEDKVLAKIYGMGRGWAFSQKDFLSIGSRGAIDQALSRLCHKGTIRRIARGLYDYPKCIESTGRMLSPDYNQLANAIARKRGWQIYPSGVAALNLLGISSQVPSKLIYLSDGPTSTVEAGPWTLHFKNTALREMKLKPQTALLVQAIKSYGRDRFDDEAIEKFRKALHNGDCRKILKDAQGITDWVYEIVRRICLGGSNG